MPKLLKTIRLLKGVMHSLICYLISTKFHHLGYRLAPKPENSVLFTSSPIADRNQLKKVISPRERVKSPTKKQLDSINVSHPALLMKNGKLPAAKKLSISRKRLSKNASRNETSTAKVLPFFQFDINLDSVKTTIFHHREGGTDQEQGP